MLVSTSAGLILLKPPNDCDFLAIERVKLNSKKLLICYTLCDFLNTGLNRRLISFI